MEIDVEDIPISRCPALLASHSAGADIGTGFQIWSTYRAACRANSEHHFLAVHVSMNLDLKGYSFGMTSDGVFWIRYQEEYLK